MDYTTKEGKKSLIKRFTPKTKIWRNLPLSFIFGGAICIFAEMLRRLYMTLGINEKISLTLVSVSMVVIASLLTAIGLFDKIAKYAGAGTLVPITGFANSITSEALDARSEGFVLGVGAKIFTVAGPVILYGISSGVLYGIIYVLWNFFSTM